GSVGGTDAGLGVTGSVGGGGVGVGVKGDVGGSGIGLGVKGSTSDVGGGLGVKGSVTGTDTGSIGGSGGGGSSASGRPGGVAVAAVSLRRQAARVAEPVSAAAGRQAPLVAREMLPQPVRHQRRQVPWGRR